MAINNLISIIIPCYNYGSYIIYTLDSVACQTYINWECIIVDDGSTDNTKDIVSSYITRDKRFVYIYQDNRGLSAARNAGIQEAKGAFIQFLDSDDLIERKKLENQIQYFLQHPEVDIVYGDVRYFSSDSPHERLLSMDGRNEAWMPKISGQGNEVLRYLIERNIMAVSSPLIKRRVIGICGLFDETLRSFEDWDYWLRCAINGMIFSYNDSSESTTLIRYHSQSMTRNTNLMLTAELIVRKRINIFLPHDETYFTNKKHYVNKGITLALNCLKSDNKLHGMVLLIKYIIIHYVYRFQRIFLNI